MKRLQLTLIAMILAVFAQAQDIVAAKPAILEVYLMKTDGTQLVMTSREMSVTYDGLQMNGTLDLSTLQADDPVLVNLLDSAVADRITFSGVLPEGKFVFHDAMNEQFTVETELNYGDLKSHIVVSFDVSNRKSSIANTFDISCTGSLSLSEDLGVSRETGLDDRISFRFSQNVQVKSY